MAMLNETSDLTMQTLNQSFFYDIHDVIDSIHIENQQIEKDSTWSAKYHSKYGLCYTLDIRKDLSLDLTSSVGPLQLTCHFKEESHLVIDYGVILLHNSDDLASANHHSSVLRFGQWFNYDYKIRKSKVCLEQTDQAPCSNMYLQTCLDIEVSRHLEKNYNCTTFLLKSRGNDSLPYCNKDEVYKAFTMQEEIGKNCSPYIPCRYSRYHVNFMPQFPVNSAVNIISPINRKDLTITMDDTIVQYQTSIGYTTANFVGEVGGTMGIFLGWSILYLLEVLIGLIRFKSIRSIIKSCCIFILAASFIFWSHDVFVAYFGEYESMQFLLEKISKVPHLTLCADQSFKTSLGSLYPCSNYPEDGSFFEKIKNCLITDPTTSILSSLANMEYEQLGIILPVSLTLTSKVGSTVMLNGNVLRKTFHQKYGLCYTLSSHHWNRYYSTVRAPL